MCIATLDASNEKGIRKEKVFNFIVITLTNQILLHNHSGILP